MSTGGHTGREVSRPKSTRIDEYACMIRDFPRELSNGRPPDRTAALLLRRLEVRVGTVGVRRDVDDISDLRHRLFDGDGDAL